MTGARKKNISYVDKTTGVHTNQPHGYKPQRYRPFSGIAIFDATNPKYESKNPNRHYSGVPLPPGHSQWDKLGADLKKHIYGFRGPESHWDKLEALAAQPGGTWWDEGKQDGDPISLINRFLPNGFVTHGVNAWDYDVNPWDPIEGGVEPLSAALLHGAYESSGDADEGTVTHEFYLPDPTGHSRADPLPRYRFPAPPKPTKRPKPIAQGETSGSGIMPLWML